MAKKSITAKEFDEKFDNNEDVSEFLDTKRASKKVNVDFTIEFLKELDEVASKIGVTRQSLIKIWLHDRLRAEKRGGRVSA